MHNNEPPIFSTHTDNRDDTISLTKSIEAISQKKWKILTLSIAASVITVAICFLLPVKYKSDTVLSITSSQASLLDTLQLPSSLSKFQLGSSTEDTIETILTSRNFIFRIINKYQLLPVIFRSKWDNEKNTWKIKSDEDPPNAVLAYQEKIIEKFYTVEQGPGDGCITVSWIAEDPEFCKLMLTRITEDLREYLLNDYTTDAKREREFVEHRLEFIKEQLDHIENMTPDKNQNSQDIEREALVFKKIYATLLENLELARISEAKEELHFKTISDPYVPVKKFFPKKAKAGAIAFALTLFLTSLYFIIKYNLNAQSNRTETNDAC